LSSVYGLRSCFTQPCPCVTIPLPRDTAPVVHAGPRQWLRLDGGPSGVLGRNPLVVKHGTEPDLVSGLSRPMPRGPGWGLFVRSALPVQLPGLRAKTGRARVRPWVVSGAMQRPFFVAAGMAGSDRRGLPASGSSRRWRSRSNWVQC